MPASRRHWAAPPSLSQLLTRALVLRHDDLVFLRLLHPEAQHSEQVQEQQQQEEQEASSSEEHSEDDDQQQLE